MNFKGLGYAFRASVFYRCPTIFPFRMNLGATDCVLSSIFLDLIPLDFQISLIIPIGSVGSSISVVGGGEFHFASSGGGWFV